jgi:hypothetical protein
MRWPDPETTGFKRKRAAAPLPGLRSPPHIPNNLDLLETPSIFFYESGYSTHVLRQASRRSWRIGQKRPVRVAYMTYAGSAQERCLRLMGKKMLVSLALEGKFASHGLTAMDQDDDVLTSLARELVTERGIGERAAAVWRSLQRERQDPPTDPTEDVNSNVPPLEAEPAFPSVKSNLIELPLIATPIRRSSRQPACDDQQLTFGF